MAGPSITPLSPWRWLQQAFALLRARPRALVGATSLLLAVALAPSVVQLALATTAPQLAQVLALVLALLVFPPAMAGYFRVVHLLAQGGDVAPSALFSVFSDGLTVRRAILANVIIVCASLLLVTALVSLFGGEALLEYMQALSTLQPGAKSLPPAPPGVLPLMVALTILVAAIGSVQALAYAEMALSSRAPLPAIGAALGAVARHFGVLLMFYVPIAVFAFLAFMLVALVAVLVGSALALLVPALGPMLVMALGLLLVLLMYALLFTFFYFAWRELFGDAAMPPPASTSSHEIAA